MQSGEEDDIEVMEAIPCEDIVLSEQESQSEVRIINFICFIVILIFCGLGPLPGGIGGIS
jgi:hypothetical protein